MACRIKTLCQKGAVLPVYKTSGAAGADVCAYLENDVVIKKVSVRL